MLAERWVRLGWPPLVFVLLVVLPAAIALSFGGALLLRRVPVLRRAL